MCYVLGHVGANKIIGEILCHSGGLGSPNKAPHLPLHYICTPSEHFYLSKIKEITMEALKWRTSHKRAETICLCRGRCVFYKGEFLELVGDFIFLCPGKKKGHQIGQTGA